MSNQLFDDNAVLFNSPISRLKSFGGYHSQLALSSTHGRVQAAV